MEKVLIIIDDAYDTEATEFAYDFAGQTDADLIIVQISQPQPDALSRDLVVNYNRRNGQQAQIPGFGSLSGLSPNAPCIHQVKTVNFAGATSCELAEFIRKENCSMIISKPKQGGINLQKLLNKVSCPLMLLPENAVTAKPKRIVYLTDMRYCQLPILSILSKLRGTSLLLAHMCEQGLPDLNLTLGEELFKDTAGCCTPHSDLFFSHVKEKNMKGVVDTLVNTMGTDMLACVNRKFHFQQLFGDYLPKRMPEHITVPVLVFPC